MSEVKRYYWLDILKIIACLCVIVNHFGGLILDFTNYSHSSVVFYCIQFALCKIGVPLFIMVTGYLFLKSEKGNNFTYKTVLKRIFRIFVPLFIISLLVTIKNNGINNFNLLIFLKSFVSEPYSTVYWYLYMLIGLYIVTPFVNKMINKFQNIDYKFFIILFLIFPAIISLVNIYFNFNVSSYFFESFFPGIIAYYISGVYLAKIDIKKEYFIIAWFFFFVLSGLFFLTLYLPYLKAGTISYAFDSYLSIFVIIQSFSIFYIVRYIFENQKFNKMIAKIISEISKTTFGIYLIHYFTFNRIINLSIIKNIFSFNAIIGVVLTELCVFIICGIITYILRKIPLVKNFL